MIKGIRFNKEITVAVENKVGALADISKTLSDSGINLDAVAGYASGNEAKIMIVADNAQGAQEVLRKSGYKSIKENEIVVVELENKPGALKYITQALAAEGLDIKHIYGTACACASGCPCRLVLSTSDNNKAMACLKK